MLVEFDHTNYAAIEGEDVIFRIVKRTDSNQEVTVTFTITPDSASGESTKGALNILIDFTMISLSNLCSIFQAVQWVLRTLRYNVYS